MSDTPATPPSETVTPVKPEERELYLKWVQKLAAAQELVKDVGKKSRNDFNEYDYASAEDILREARGCLLQAGLYAARPSYEIELSSVPLNERWVERSRGWWVQVAHDYIHCQFEVTDSETAFTRTFKCPYPICEKKGQTRDKEVNAALTTSWAYFLLGLLAIPRGGDEVDQDNMIPEDQPPINYSQHEQGNRQQPNNPPPQNSPPPNQQNRQPPPNNPPNDPPQGNQQQLDPTKINKITDLPPNERPLYDVCMEKLMQCMTVADMKEAWSKLQADSMLPIKGSAAWVLLMKRAKEMQDDAAQRDKESAAEREAIQEEGGES